MGLAVGTISQRNSCPQWHIALGYSAMAIRKITSLLAGILGLKDRGLLKEGYRVDIVVKDR